MLLNEIISAVLQLGFVLIICALAWLVFARRRSGFRAWIGLTAPTPASMGWALVLFAGWSVISSALYFLPAFTALAGGTGTVAGQLSEHGFSAELVAVILVIALIKTGLSEEILFRGLIGKRLIGWLGFWTGNTLQAVLFGAIHLAVFLVPGGPSFSWMLAGLLVAGPGAAGWIMGFANEKLGNGSIAPGWLIHGLGNAVSYPVLAFLV
ncbi:MAG: CPBP family glutamic-type intramembrane protease [Oceanicaulis sp.]